MSTYVLVSFWIGVFALTVRLCWLGWGDYPREYAVSRGVDVVMLALQLAFSIWAAWLLWGAP